MNGALCSASFETEMNERSSGTNVVRRWGCDRGDAVEVTFKAVVGSEFGDGEVVRAAGTVTTEIGDPPE